MNTNRIDAITGLRGLAALMVVFGHVFEQWFGGVDTHVHGGVGVTIFFSLSGFLMAYLYLHKEFSKISLANYAVARFSRIAPAYLFILLISFVVYNFFDSQFVYAISEKNLLRHMLFAGNVSVFWSIPPEVQFYILFAVLWAAMHRFVRRADVTAVVLVILVAALVLSYRQAYPGTFIGSKLHYFLFGAAAGMLRSKLDAHRQNIQLLNLIQAGLIGLMLAVELGWISLAFDGGKNLYDSLLSAVFSSLLVFTFSFPSFFGKLLFENKLLKSCGDWSFSIYLIHMPVLYVFIKYFSASSNHGLLAGLMLVIVLLLSWLNFSLIEKPGARLIRNVGARLIAKIRPSTPLATVNPSASRPA